MALSPKICLAVDIPFDTASCAATENPWLMKGLTRMLCYRPPHMHQCVMDSWIVVKWYE